MRLAYRGEKQSFETESTTLGISIWRFLLVCVKTLLQLLDLTTFQIGFLPKNYVTHTDLERTRELIASTEDKMLFGIISFQPGIPSRYFDRDSLDKLNKIRVSRHSCFLNAK
ncbi:hypothetical protein CDAR_285131 [Caerostris darwini]|uniref:Uncharacterized protein n=1 Tax=Caerostris darwini TaxID=1538125 RepID=A0AAV4VB89_9ARAC|nr:hypothetical protein CDAR_285131 [Caerostris darwini]